MADKFQIRRGNFASLPVLDDGELGYAEDTNQMFIGSTGGNKLLSEDDQDQTIVLDSDDITNGYVDLTSKASVKSLHVYLNGISGAATELTRAAFGTAERSGITRVFIDFGAASITAGNSMYFQWRKGTPTGDAPVPHHLAFGQQPTECVEDSDITPPITVEVQDSDGNPVRDDTTLITLTIQTGSGAITGATANCVGGIATFSTVKLDTPGMGTVLRAARSGLTSVNSDAFDVLAANITTIVWDEGQSQNISVAGPEITKSGVVEDTPDAGILSIDHLLSTGYVELDLTKYHRTEGHPLYAAFGLTSAFVGGAYAYGFDYNMSLNNGSIDVYQGGSLVVPGASSYIETDKLQVILDGSTVKYAKNGVVFYTSLVAPTTPLYCQVALYTNASFIDMMSIAQGMLP